MDNDIDFWENSSSGWLLHFLQQLSLAKYYSKLSNELKIHRLSDFKRVKASDLESVGLSCSEARSLSESAYQQRQRLKHELCQTNTSTAYIKDKVHHASKAIGREMKDFISKDKRTCEPFPSAMPYNSSSCTSASASKKASEKFSASSNCSWLIQESSLILGDVLATGSFGVVHKAKWLSPSNGKTISVAVKILKSDIENQANAYEEVFKEVNLMHSLRHENLISLYGIVLSQPLKIVTELAPLGSLLMNLRKCSGGSPRSDEERLHVDLLVEYSIQIVAGMRYLESQGYLHRDLAARNILLASRTLVKICDFGLMKILPRGQDYYVMEHSAKLPFAWCAPESLERRQFSHSSDVWMFGVTLWEIFTLGKEPWCGMRTREILLELANGVRLPMPDLCPRALYREIMKPCWKSDPSKRPTFSELSDKLNNARPFLVIAMHSLDEADRLGLEPEDKVLVLDGRPNKSWWKGQNCRTGEVGTFPRRLIFIDRKLTNKDISTPIKDTLVHTGHISLRGNDWGHIDKIDENNLESYDVDDEASSSDNDSITDYVASSKRKLKKAASSDSTPRPRSLDRGPGTIIVQEPSPHPSYYNEETSLTDQPQPTTEHPDSLKPPSPLLIDLQDTMTATIQKWLEKEGEETRLPAEPSTLIEAPIFPEPPQEDPTTTGNSSRTAEALLIDPLCNNSSSHPVTKPSSYSRCQTGLPAFTPCTPVYETYGNIVMKQPPSSSSSRPLAPVPIQSHSTTANKNKSLVQSDYFSDLTSMSLNGGTMGSVLNQMATSLQGNKTFVKPDAPAETKPSLNALMASRPSSVPTPLLTPNLMSRAPLFPPSSYCPVFPQNPVINPHIPMQFGSMGNLHFTMPHTFRAQCPTRMTAAPQPMKPAITYPSSNPPPLPEVPPVGPVPQPVSKPRKQPAQSKSVILSNLKASHRQRLYAEFPPIEYNQATASPICKEKISQLRTLVDVDITPEEAHMALIQNNWDIFTAINSVHIEILFGLGFNISKERCRTVLEEHSWVLQRSANFLVDEYGMTELLVDL